MTDSFVTRTLKQMSFRLTLIISIATLASILHLGHVIELEMMGILDKYIEERGSREASQFILARQNHEVVSKEYLQVFNLPSNAEIDRRFKSLVKMYPDGVMRNSDPNFDGTHMTGIFIGKGAKITADLKRKVVTAYDIVNRFGVGFHSSFQDLYFSFSENALVLYWPEDPKWVFNANDQLNVGNEIYHSSATPEKNPQRKAVWTDLFFDKVSSIWMTTATTPIYIGDRYIGNVSHDLMVKELLDRTINVRLDGASNYVVTEKGYVIAGAHIMEQLKANDGVVKIADLKDPLLSAIWETSSQSPNDFGTNRVKKSGLNFLMAHYKLAGPGWIFVTTYPQERIWWTAINNAGWVFAAGILSLLFELYLLYQVLATRIRKPLLDLLAATKKITKGQYKVHISYDHADEIGDLVHSVQTMSRTIEDRDQRIEKHNAELELLVERRTSELAEQKVIALHSAKLAALGEMAAGLAHELNTPLNIISLNSERMMQMTLNPRVEPQQLGEISQLISTTVGRISKIITGLRSFAGDSTTETFHTHSLYDLIQNSLNMCYERYTAAGIQIHLEYHASDLNLECQSGPISQVFLNLLNNAHDAVLNRSEDDKWIRIQIVEDQAGFKILFTDSGQGLDANQRAKLFQPFFTTKKIGQGTGMGLSVSKGIIESHQGSISLNPTDPNTQFMIHLPKKQKTKVAKAI